MLKKLTRLFFLSFIIFTFSALSASADSNGLEIDSIVTNKNAIMIDWSNAGYSYNVYKDDLLVYSGKESEFKSKDLEEDHVYSFRIEALDDKGNKVDVLKLQTTTDKPGRNANKELNDAIVTTILKDSKVEMDWDDIKGVESYDIYRNDQFIKTVKESGFIDWNIDVDAEYTYSVVGKRMIDEQRKAELETFLHNNNVSKSNENVKDLYYDEVNIVKEISNIRGHLEPNIVKTAATTYLWNLTYKTFLADQWVKNPNPLSKYVWFAGDNRGYSEFSNAYRTKAAISVCFCSAGRSVGLSRDVGTTHGYDANKKFLASATASSSGITLSDVVTSSTSKISFKLNHAVGNPLVASLDVDYWMKGEFYSNGNYKLSGEHDQAPHHEVYMQTNSGAFNTMYQAASKGLEYLAPPMPNKTWTKSNF